MKFSGNALNILYEDTHILAIDKPAGLLSQPSSVCSISLEGYAKLFLKKKYHKTGNVFLHPVHRLDKPVSGIVLFAKTSKALSRLNAQMRLRKIKKIYSAKVEGHLKEKSGKLCHFLSHAPYCAKIGKVPRAKQGILFYVVKREDTTTSLLSIRLETGRYHQIRSQLAYIGHPIVGDIKYGSKHSFFRLALHHTELVFSHPVTRETISIISEIPFDSWGFKK